MDTVTEAVVLMAGAGSRLQKAGSTLIKPLVTVAGRPLISYTFECLGRAGIRTVYAVVGFQAEALVSQVRPIIPQDLDVRFVTNHDWQKQNGISVLAAAGHVQSPFVLSMSDHLFDQSIIDLLLRDAKLDQLNLAIDRKIELIADLDDAMKVQTRGEQIVAIAKNLTAYDAIDTGLFVCPLVFFDYLEQAKQNNDCSLADGVRRMAGEGKVRGVDIGSAWWQDVDTPEMLRHAEEMLKARARKA